MPRPASAVGRFTQTTLDPLRVFSSAEKVTAVGSNVLMSWNDMAKL